MDDPFIQQYIGELLRSLRTSFLIDLLKPYTRVEMSFLATVSLAITISSFIHLPSSSHPTFIYVSAYVDGLFGGDEIDWY